MLVPGLLRTGHDPTVNEVLFYSFLRAFIERRHVGRGQVEPGLQNCFGTVQYEASRLCPQQTLAPPALLADASNHPRTDTQKTERWGNRDASKS